MLSKLLSLYHNFSLGASALAASRLKQGSKQKNCFAVPSMPLPPVYLVELFGEAHDPSLSTDVCARLPVAIQKVHSQLMRHRQSARVKVSYDAAGGVDGVAFLDQEDCLLACITAYRMEHDNEAVSLEPLKPALLLPEPLRSQALNQLFTF